MKSRSVTCITCCHLILAASDGRPLCAWAMKPKHINEPRHCVFYAAPEPLSVQEEPDAHQLPIFADAQGETNGN